MDKTEQKLIEKLKGTVENQDVNNDCLYVLHLLSLKK